MQALSMALKSVTREQKVILRLEMIGELMNGSVGGLVTIWLAATRRCLTQHFLECVFVQGFAEVWCVIR